jgi:hypothetical protein
MVVTKKQILSESEVNRIRGLYGINPIKQEQYVFEACITADERYFIMNDDVFDIQEKTLVGNLWESMDVFKTIFQNVKIVDEGFQDIRESIINLPITESREDLQEIKKLMLEYDLLGKLKSWGNDFMNNTWVGKELKSAEEGISDFVSKSWEGLKQFGITISKGDWSEIMSLLGRGVLWVLRKLKNAMYSNLGMIVDAVLIATGVGKTVQWIPWALITALDVYQITNNDYPEEEKDNPMWLKLLFLGFDILGLVSAGVVAKAARLEAEGLKAVASQPGMVAKFLKNSPKLRGFIESIVKGASKVPEMLNNAISSIAKKAPKVANFIKGITGGLSKILKELGESLTKLLGTSGAAVVKTGAALYAFDKASDKIFGTGEGEGENMEDGSEMAGLSDNEKQTIELFNQTYTPITVQTA